MWQAGISAQIKGIQFYADHIPFGSIVATVQSIQTIQGSEKLQAQAIMRCHDRLALIKSFPDKWLAQIEAIHRRGPGPKQLWWDYCNPASSRQIRSSCARRRGVAFPSR